MHSYIINHNIHFNCGFPLTTNNVMTAIHNTNDVLEKLPASLFRSIDYKTTSAMIGCILCENIALTTDGAAIVNPIEKGHPDIVPHKAVSSTEEQLRNYPIGLEVKCTIGGIPKDVNINKAAPRIDYISNVTWQAHHQEVNELFGITFDYIRTPSGYKPVISATFYSDELCVSDWGDISGTEGRNTKVCGMKASGKTKMGAGWFAILSDTPIYWQKYSYLFKIVAK
nr:hypothetical protein [uncultured Blautia sp.]